MASVNELIIDLFAPGMTSLHRVGLAGLWMTLDALERDPGTMTKLRGTGGSWDRTPRSVTLRWTKRPETFFQALFRASFKVDKNGLIWFTALGEPIDHKEHAVVLHNAVLGTFLQHGKKEIREMAGDGSISIEIGDVPYPLIYKKLKSYAHQTRADLPTDGSTRALKGWHYPGGAVRHTGLGQTPTAIEEPVERLLPLLFAPVGGIYFRIRRRGERTQGVRHQFALVIPDITDLGSYAKARAQFLKHGFMEFEAAGSAEAGLRVLATLHARGLLKHLRSVGCRVVTFGVVPWSKQQKTRVDLFTVRPDAVERLRVFQICQSQRDFIPHLVKPKKGEPFLTVPQLPDLVARNLCERRPWWWGFADSVAPKVGSALSRNYES